MAEGSTVRLGDPELLLDLDVLEEPAEGEPVDLASLRLGGAVRHQPKADAVPFEPSQRVDGPRKRPDLLLPDARVAVGHAARCLRVRDAETGEGPEHDVPPGLLQVEAASARALRVVPQPLPGVHDGGVQPLRGHVAKVAGELAAELPPGFVRVAVRVEDRVVEIKEQGRWQSCHVDTCNRAHAVVAPVGDRPRTALSPPVTRR